jgi:hypothetical protein
LIREDYAHAALGDEVDVIRKTCGPEYGLVCSMSESRLSPLGAEDYYVR